MARWSKERQETARGKMLVAARDAFDQHGYDGTTMRQIADESGVAVGTLFNYFPDKRALLREALYADLDRVIESVEPGGEATLKELFVATARPFVRYYWARPTLSRVLLRDTLFADDDRSEDFREQAARVGRKLLRGVQDLQETGAVSPSASPEAIVLAFFSHYYFVLMTQLGAGEESDVLRQIGLLAQQLTDGVGGT